MKRRRRESASDVARKRQRAGDTRPLMLIMQEENVLEIRRRVFVRRKPVVRLVLPDEIVFPDE